MSEAVVARTWDGRGVARAVLAASAVLWFIPAAIGQGIFATYIAIQYIRPALFADLSGWNEVMPNGIIAGDLIGNIALIIHLFIAFVITVGGVLQQIPAIRTHAPAFHRWNGRLYIVIVLLTSVAALYMTWTRDQIGTIWSTIAISIDAALIIAFALMTIRTAGARRFAEHNRWALRTFMVVSAVWFMRVSYGLLIMLAQGQPSGVAEDMTGPTDIAIGFWSYLLPLAVLEIYFLAKRGGSLAKLGAAALVTAAALATSIGVVGATMIMWLPRISG